MKETKRQIKYQLWIDGYLNELKRTVEFLFCMPETYDSYEDAEKDQSSFAVVPCMDNTGEVFFEVYKRHKTGDSESMVFADKICWKDFRKYESQILSEAGIRHTLAELEPDLAEKVGFLALAPCMTDEDLEPYADRFEVMYAKYLDTDKYTIEDICGHPVQSTSYEIRPIIVED